MSGEGGDGDAQSDVSRQMLSMYYGIGMGSDNPAAIPEAPNKTRQEILDPVNLDSSNFDPDLYLKGLLAEKGFKELIDSDNNMIGEKKTLDSDMQRLVYENYNKFISATDMIRTMKRNVEGMEEEMKNLSSNINLITTYSHTVEENLSNNRGKVDNLVGVSRLLKRLEFLFELPGRLKKSIAFGAHAQAVKYFRVSNRILRQYSHIKSFDKIRIESEEIILSLKDTLRKLVRDPKQSPQALMENAAMLIDLSEAPDELLSDVFASRRNRLKADLQSAVDQYTKQQQNPPSAEEEEEDGDEDVDEKANEDDDHKEDEEKDERKSKHTQSKSAKSVTSASKSKTSKSANGVQVDDDKDREDSKRNSLLGLDEKHDDEHDGQNGHGEDGTEESQRRGKKVAHRKKKSKPKLKTKDLLQFLQTNFVDSFELFAQSFLDTFIRPYESKYKRLDKEKATTLEKCRDALTEFTRELFNEYFIMARRHLLTRAELVLTNPQPATSSSTTSSSSTSSSSISTSSSVSSANSSSPTHAADSTNNSVQVTQPNPEADKESIVELTRILRHFWLGLNKPATLVPKARLGDRATEIIEHTVRHCVESVFAKTQANIVRILKRLHGYVSLYDSRPEPPDADDDGDEKHDSTKTTKAKFKGKPPNTTKVSGNIREAIEQSLKLLVPVLSTSEYLPAAVGLVFGDLAHGHFHTLLGSLNSIILCRILRESEGPVWDGEASTHPLADLNTLTSAYAHPLFYLYLSLICQRMESTDIPAALKFLKQTFPSADERQMLETEVPQLLDRMKESGHALVQRYVEVNGILLTRMVRKLLRAQRLLAGFNSSPVPTETVKKDVVGVSLLVTAVLREIDTISNELNEIFPTSNRDTYQSQVSAKDAMSQGSFRGAPGMAGNNSTKPGRGKQNQEMNRDIERLFTQKVVIYAPIKYSRAHALVAALKIIFKTMVETIRLWNGLPEIAYQQIQADVYVLRGEVAKLIAPDDAKTVLLLLDEALSSASDRCSVVPGQLKPTELEDIYTKFKSSRAPTSSSSTSSSSSSSNSSTSSASSTSSPSPTVAPGVPSVSTAGSSANSDSAKPPLRPTAKSGVIGASVPIRRSTLNSSPPPVSAAIDARAQLFGGAVRPASSAGVGTPLR